MAEANTTPKAAAPEKTPPVPEVDIICLPSHPHMPKSREDIVYAKRIASRYLNLNAIEQIAAKKREAARKKIEAAAKHKLETPEDYYDQGVKYLAGARCAVPFQEQAAYYQKAAEMFAQAGDLNDAPQLTELYTAQSKTTLEEGYRAAYQSALDKKKRAVSENDWFTAARAFERISGYQDADQMAQECETRLKRIHAARRPLTIAAVVLAVLVIFGAVRLVQTDAFRYQAAKALASMGMESTATQLLSGVEYKDSDELMNQIRYEQGLEKMEKGSYSSAASLFGKCEGYADSDMLAQECHYYLAEAAVEKENYESALNHLLKAWDWEGSEELRCQTEVTYLAQLEPGDRMTYGKDEFILLDKTEEHALLLSSKLYGGALYNASTEDVSWADSDMRAALNSAYTEDRFSQAEIDLMEETETEDGVTDQIFLLSAEEYLAYQEVMGSKKALWWLRDVNETTGTAVFVSSNGDLMDAGYPVDSESIQGRAAFWISLTASPND
ncbi:MAG: DUF6273 domain-containing protein [Clostridiales bacterium]|nr:DUF6273 domain-containing protein [Clostridiales bacterium]